MWAQILRKLKMILYQRVYQINNGQGDQVININI